MEEQVIGGRRVGRTSIVVMKQFRVQKRKKTSKKGSVRHQNDGKSVQKFSPWMSYHPIFVFLIPCLIDVLEVNSQGSTKSLFETHTTNMWIFLVAAFIYSFAFAIDRKSHHLHYTISSQLSSAVAIVSGSLSVASLVSMIVPLKFQHFSFIAWAFLSLIIVSYQYDALFKHPWFWLHKKMRRIVDKFLELWNRFKERNKLREQQQEQRQRQQLPV